MRQSASIFARGARALALGALVVLPAGLAAAAPADDYVATRAKYVAALLAAENAGEDQAALDALDTKDRADLEARLKAILGPVTFDGFPEGPDFQPETLLDGYLGSGALDGLRFGTEDWSRRIVVTPKTVFEDWLARLGAGEGGTAAFRAGIPAALDDSDLFTYGLSTDAAFGSYAPLPVKAAGGEEARAFLGMFAQDITQDAPPTTIVVARVGADRVELAAVDLAMPVARIAACDAVWKTEAVKAEAAQAAAQAADGNDALWDKAFAAQADATAAFQACFARELPSQPGYAALVSEAEALLATARGR